MMSSPDDDRTMALRAALVDHAVRGYRAHRIRKTGTLVGACVTVAGLAVAFTTIHAAPAVDRGEVHCRAGVSTNSIDVGATAGVSSLDPQASPKYGNAIDTCASLWRQGILTPGPDFPNDIARPSAGQIPPMVICVDDNGTPIVIPGIHPDACGALGLAKALT